MVSELSFIGRNIRFLRRQRGWTMAELAKKAGVAEVPLGRMERGENAPSAAALYGLSQALGVSVDMLFSETDRQRLVLQVDEGNEPVVCTLGPEQKKLLPPKIRAIATDLIQAFCSLEDLCRAHKHAKIPLFIPFAPDPAGMDNLAQAVRRYMGIENGVVFDYFELFENTGFRVILLRLPKTIQSFSYYDRPNQNAFYFLNSRLNPERQLFKLVYEFGQVLILTATLQQGGDPFSPETGKTVDNEDSAIPDSAKPFTAHRAARRFAACFLMPGPAVRETVLQLGIGPDQMSYELLLRIKHRFGISAQAFLYRLDELGLIAPLLKETFDKKIKQYYSDTDYCEPDCSRRLLTPNGRLWDLLLVAKQIHAGSEEVVEIENLLHRHEVEKL